MLSSNLVSMTTWTQFFGFITLSCSAKWAHASGRNQFTVLVQSLKHEGPHTQQRPFSATVMPTTEIQQGCDLAGAVFKFNLHQSKRKAGSTAELPYCGLPVADLISNIKDVTFAWIRPTLCIWSLKNGVWLGDTPTQRVIHMPQKPWLWPFTAGSTRTSGHQDSG